MPNIFNKVFKTSIYLLVFLVPIFFLPFSLEAYEFNKQYLLFFLVSIAFFAWLARMILIDKEIRFRRTPFDLPILVLLGVAILSAIFSVDKISSLFGFYGRFSDGLLGLLSLAALYFLITNNVSVAASKKSQIPNNSGFGLRASGLIKAFLWSVALVVLATYFSLFGVWQVISNKLSIINDNLSLPLLMLQRTFNPVAGSLEGLAIFLAVSVVLLVGLILNKSEIRNPNDEKNPKSQAPKTKQFGLRASGFGLITLLVASLGLLLIVDFTPVWVVLLITLTLFTGFALWTRMFRENVNKLLLPIFLIIIAVVSIFINYQSSFIGKRLSLPQEQTLTQGTSWKIAGGSMRENIKSVFLGSGLGTFHYDFSKFKPQEFNQTSFWQIRFDRAGNGVAERTATTGVLGLLSWLTVIVMFLMTSYFFVTGHRLKVKAASLVDGQKSLGKNQKLKPKDQTGSRDHRPITIPLLMAVIALIVAQFVYYQNTVLNFTFWLFLGLSVVAWQTSAKEKKISFKDFPEMALVFNIVLILIGLAFLGMFFFGLKFYWADIQYAKAMASSSQMNIEKRIATLEKVVQLNPFQSQYKVVLARVYLNKVNSEMLKPADQQDQTVLSQSVFKSITYAKGGILNGKKIKGAVELSPNRVANWETLGMIYRDIGPAAAGATEWGIKAFEKAIELEPTNPVLWTELGKLYSVSGENEKAKEKFEKALEMKSDYIDAELQLAFLSERQNNLGEAIRKIEGLVERYPLNPEVLFQLGRLYFNNNQIDKAISQFQKVLNLVPNHSNAHYSLGVAYQKKGDRAAAIKEFEKVLELNPNNEDVKQKLRELGR